MSEKNFQSDYLRSWILPIEQDMYSIAPSVKLRGLNPNANIYIICATANMHIPAVKQLGHTNSASPMQLNTNPVNIRLEKAYLQKEEFYVSNAEARKIIVK